MKTTTQTKTTRSATYTDGHDHVTFTFHGSDYVTMRNSLGETASMNEADAGERMMHLGRSDAWRRV